MSQTTIAVLKRLKSESKKFTCLTAYDASFAQLLSTNGIEVLLVGDSLGMVLQGHDSTVPVTLEQMAYHVECTARGNQGALLMADMPFMSYATPEQALDTAATLMQAGAHMIKLEGGAWLTDTISQLSQCGIPVCAHLGLTPQSINKLGGYRVQGRNDDAAQQIMDDALALQDVGADIILLECVPTDLASKLTKALSVPTIGIGAGPGTDAQVLVLHDLLGIASDYSPKFVKNFLQEGGNVQAAIAAYAEAVKNGTFPGPEHCYG